MLLENFRPGTMDKLGFGYATLAEQNPKLVYCSISGFGESGPEAGRAGYDLVVQAESGLMDITGFADGPPVKVGNVDRGSRGGHVGRPRCRTRPPGAGRTRRGQKVEISMLDTMAALLTYQAGIYFATGQRPTRRGNAHPSIVPYEVFTASDGFVTLGVANNSLWQRCCKALERPDLVTDPLYDTETKRVENREALIPLLNQIMSARTGRRVAQAIRGGRRPGRTHQERPRSVREPSSAGSRYDRQPCPTRRPGRSPSWEFPYSFTRTPGGLRQAPPRLGEHTAEVLRRLARVPARQIPHLRERGVI